MRKYQSYSFPLKLKMLRLETGKSQEEFARELGISRSCLANYETGKRQPDNEMITKIANTFHVMTDFLIDRPTYGEAIMREEDLFKGRKLKELIQNRGNSLDMSNLAIEHKIALIEYYDFVLCAQRRKQYNRENHGK